MHQLNRAQLQQQVKILGWLHIIGHLFFVLLGWLVFFLLMSIGAVSGDKQALAVLSLVGTFVAGLLTLLGLPGIVAGFGLLARKVWARYLGIGVGVLSLVNFPLGTLIGAYTLWVLMQEGANECFADGGNGAIDGIVGAGSGF